MSTRARTSGNTGTKAKPKGPGDDTEDAAQARVSTKPATTSKAPTAKGPPQSSATAPVPTRARPKPSAATKATSATTGADDPPRTARMKTNPYGRTTAPACTSVASAASTDTEAHMPGLEALGPSIPSLPVSSSNHHNIHVIVYDKVRYIPPVLTSSSNPNSLQNHIRRNGPQYIGYYNIGPWFRISQITTIFARKLWKPPMEIYRPSNGIWEPAELKEMLSVADGGIILREQFRDELGHQVNEVSNLHLYIWARQMLKPVAPALPEAWLSHPGIPFGQVIDMYTVE